MSELPREEGTFVCSTCRTKVRLTDAQMQTTMNSVSSAETQTMGNAMTAAFEVRDRPQGPRTAAAQKAKDRRDKLKAELGVEEFNRIEAERSRIRRKKKAETQTEAERLRVAALASARNKNKYYRDKAEKKEQEEKMKEEEKRKDEYKRIQEEIDQLERVTKELEKEKEEGEEHVVLQKLGTLEQAAKVGFDDVENHGWNLDYSYVVVPQEKRWESTSALVLSTEMEEGFVTIPAAASKVLSAAANSNVTFCQETTCDATLSYATVTDNVTEEATSTPDLVITTDTKMEEVIPTDSAAALAVLSVDSIEHVTSFQENTGVPTLASGIVTENVTEESTSTPDLVIATETEKDIFPGLATAPTVLSGAADSNEPVTSFQENTVPTLASYTVPENVTEETGPIDHGNFKIRLVEEDMPTQQKRKYKKRKFDSEMKTYPLRSRKVMKD